VLTLLGIIGITSTAYGNTLNATETKVNASLDNNLEDDFGTTLQDDCSQKKFSYVKNKTINSLPVNIAKNISDVETTFDLCRRLINKSEATESLDVFIDNIGKHNFADELFCKEFQDIWTKKREPWDCHETRKVGRISNVEIEMTTPVVPKVFDIVERFMKTAIDNVKYTIEQTGLDIDEVMKDRPATVLYLLLQSIRCEWPPILYRHYKRALANIEYLSNDNMPLFPASRLPNNNQHSIGLLFLIRDEYIRDEDVKDIKGTGILKVYLNDKWIFLSDMVLSYVRENAKSLFEVCKTEGGNNSNPLREFE